MFCKSFDHASRVAFARLAGKGRGARYLSEAQKLHAVSLDLVKRNLYWAAVGFKGRIDNPVTRINARG